MIRRRGDGVHAAPDADVLDVQRHVPRAAPVLRVPLLHQHTFPESEARGMVVSVGSTVNAKA